MKRLRLFALAAAVCAAVSVGFAGPAAATPARDTDGTVLWQMTDDGKDYVFREITIAPGGSTGWHSHDGQLFGVVKEGVLMHNRADCTMDGLYLAGQATCISAEMSAPARWFCRFSTSILSGRRCPTTRRIRVAGLPDTGNGHP